VSTRLDSFREQYAAAFERYLRERGEATLSAAYELGRAAVGQELGVLDLAAVHHDALVAVVAEAREHGDAVYVAGAAGDFFLESLSAYEMVQRVLRDARETALVERRQATILRQLSTFLGDASLALDSADSLDEMLQLVAEHARELIGAEWCTARLLPVGDDAPRLTAIASDSGAAGPADAKGIAAPLTALDGHELGVIQLFDKQDGDFSDLDEAVLVQLAQLASAAVERVQLYRAAR
jgi:Phosphoserine phosphatase RsbU, N-terminal domain